MGDSLVNSGFEFYECCRGGVTHKSPFICKLEADIIVPGGDGFPSLKVAGVASQTLLG